MGCIGRMGRIGRMGHIGRIGRIGRMGRIGRIGRMGRIDPSCDSPGLADTSALVLRGFFGDIFSLKFFR